MRPGWFAFCAALGVTSGCGGVGGLADDGATEVKVTIGPNGGELRSSDGNLRIVFPPGAITEDTLLTIKQDKNAIPGHIGEAYQVTPQLALFAASTVIYDYGSVDIGRPPEQLAIGANPEGSWVALEPVTLDVNLKEVSGPDMDVAFNYGLIDIGLVGGTGTDTVGGTDTDTDPSTTTEPTSTTEPTTGDPSSSTGSTGDGSDSGSTTTTGETTGADPLCGDGIPVATEVCYTEGITFNSPDGPTAVVTGDFDGDADMDVAVAGGGATGVIEVRFGNGAGILASPAQYDVGSSPVALALARMNAGTVDDLVVVNRDDETVGVLLGNSNGTFGAETAYDVTGTLPVALTIANVDGNAGLDVLTANSGSANVTLMSGDGNGVLAAAGDFAVGANPTSIGNEDFTGDTNLDFVTAAAANLTLNAGNGAGAFGGVSNAAIGGVTAGLFVADFNGDTNPDVAITNDTNNVNIALGNGSTGFGGGVPYGVGTGPTAISGADIDLDGELDLVVVNATAGTVTILIGNGLGAFPTSSTFDVGSAPTALAFADFNEDGVLDIVVTNSGDGDSTLLLSDP